MRLLSVFGTRPEAVKMAPLLLALRNEPAVETLVCVTGQHRELLDQVLAFFGISPHFDLDLMEPAQPLNRFAARTIERLEPVLEAAAPDRLLVQGDTTTALAAALAAFHRGIPVAHVEAGLRTYAPASPFPEELNRRTIDLISDLHFAPTTAAKANLCAERLNGEVFVTGNSGIDALHHVVRRLESDAALRDRIDAELPSLEADRKLVLVTGHRRESFGAPFEALCGALGDLASRGDAQIVYPLHPNPALREPAEQALAGRAGIHLVPPLGLPPFIRLMQRADLILTDSGGVQEEAAALGKPVLVARDLTERPEAVDAGAARLVGRDRAHILSQMIGLLDDPDRGRRFTRRPTLYGDGRASLRIVDALLGRPVEEFAEDPAAAAPVVTAAAE